MRFPNGVALNSWGGGAAQFASSGMDHGSSVTRVSHFYKGTVDLFDAVLGFAGGGARPADGQRNINSRVPSLVACDGEEVVRRVGSGEIVFVTQVEDAQLAPGADLPSECWRCPQSH